MEQRDFGANVIDQTFGCPKLVKMISGDWRQQFEHVVKAK
jgi:hypothetical protein